jgi:defect-in-organelle-trafficking protein DotC
MRLNNGLRPTLLTAVLLLTAGQPAIAAWPEPASDAEPHTLDWFQNYSPPESASAKKDTIRDAAVQDAALSFGARGGQAHRTWEIARVVDGLAHTLDQTFDFRAAQQTVPGGLLIDLPVITDGRAAALVAGDRKTAALADRVLRVEENVHLTLVVPTWRDYIALTWDEVAPPPTLLLPRNDDERADFKRWVADGWMEGVGQANDIFGDSVDRLTRDFVGRVRYRILVAQKMVSEPYINVTDRGVTGSSTEIRIGDRQLDITQPALLEPRSERWVATPRIQGRDGTSSENGSAKP